MPYFESGGGTKWNLLDSITGTSAINFPSSFDELLIIIKVNQNENLHHQFVIPKAFLPVDNSSMQFRTGWYSKADANGGVGVGINKAGCWIGFANYNGSDYKTNSTITVYFR